MSKPDVRAVTEGLLALSELMAPMGDAVDGYRADLERRGYSPTAAETMALDFHRYLLAALLQGQQGKAS